MSVNKYPRQSIKNHPEKYVAWLRKVRRNARKRRGTKRPKEFGQTISRKMTEYWSHQENRMAQSERQLTQWQDEDYAAKVVTNMAKALGSLKGKTSAEKIMQAVLRELRLKYKFTGQGQNLVGSCFCPDFTHTHFKWIIEVYGDYFHNLPKVAKRDERRARFMKANGYKLLVIHESELKSDIDKVKARIKKFHSKNLGKS